MVFSSVAVSNTDNPYTFDVVGNAGKLIDLKKAKFLNDFGKMWHISRLLAILIYIQLEISAITSNRRRRRAITNG